MKVVCFGHICLDLITECEFYPVEDSKVGTNTTGNRCVSQCWQRGGNASNTSTVLSFLGVDAYLCGVIADSSEKIFLLNDFKKNGVNINHCPILVGYQCPNSAVLLSRKTGSRTIVHSNQDLPELSVQQMSSVPFHTFDWLHFEGRNIENVLKMLKILSERSDCPRISVELEKNRPNIDSLITFGDVLFISKEYAISKGAQNMQDAVTKIAPLAKDGATLVCPWGELGAAVRCPSGDVVTSCAFPPSTVVDTLGAGDSFNGAFIHSTNAFGAYDAHLSTEERVGCFKRCVEYACKVAGIKVGVKGWECFKEEIRRNSDSGAMV